MKRILLVAAEESGSLHALHLIKELKGLGEYSFIGAGSLWLSREMQVEIPAGDLSFVGMEEPRKIIRILKAYRKLKRIGEECDGAILIDYPGMNLRLASHMKKLHKPVCYYVAPQLWAWGEWRINRLKKSVNALVCLFPFEEDFFRAHSVNAKFFGHPLVERLSPLKNFPKAAHIALLPGSRESEVSKLLPVMLKAVEKIGLPAIIVKAPHIPNRLYGKIPPWAKIVPFEERYRYMAQSSAAIAASGTATLELSILGIPTVVVYKTSPISWHIGRRLVKVNFISIVNILAGREVFPECLQEECTPQRIEKRLLSLLDPVHAERIKAITEEITKRLKGISPYKRAAEFFHETLSKTT